jgi:hypothetical protein
MAIITPELDKCKNETADILEELARRIRIGECAAIGCEVDAGRAMLFHDGSADLQPERKLTIEYLDFSGRL